MNKGTVLSLFDHSGIMVEPWLDAGYSAWTVDIDQPKVCQQGRVHITRDLNDWIPPVHKSFCIIFAFPPCTHLANSGATWFKAKGLTKLIEALTLVNVAKIICEESNVPWMLENPVGQLKTYWRDPDFRFDPCDYGGYQGGEGDGYTKKTCIWAGNGFVIPEPKPIPHEGSRLHYLPPTPDRARLRSMTPRGFAQAVFEANEGLEPGEGVVLPSTVAKKVERTGRRLIIRNLTK